MKKIKLITGLFVLVLLGACTDYVNNIEQPLQVVDDKNINASDVTFLTKGIQFRFAETATNILMCAEGLSDEFIFDNDVPNATFPQYQEIDDGQMLTDNNSIRQFFNDLGELRFYADDIVNKVSGYTTLTESVKKNALYIGYFYGGLARYYYATYFGRSANEGGATINKSAFIPSAQMYTLALEKLKLALDWAPDEVTKRIVNTHIARIYLFIGDYVNAANYALQGMAEGDASFDALYSLEYANQFYIYAGRYRAQFVMDFRFKDYVDANPQEASRVVIEPVEGNSGAIFYMQAKMLKEDDPVVAATWQENSLMLAELSLRGQATGDALALVNQVRASHNIDPLTSTDLNTIYDERDKELNCMGLRLPDERRFNKWHLPGKWQYFPLTIDELNTNPNL
jgi:tetratricopeptide (TPR) repeat protein